MFTGISTELNYLKANKDKTEESCTVSSTDDSNLSLTADRGFHDPRALVAVSGSSPSCPQGRLEEAGGWVSPSAPSQRKSRESAQASGISLRRGLWFT